MQNKYAGEFIYNDKLSVIMHNMQKFVEGNFFQSVCKSLVDQHLFGKLPIEILAHIAQDVPNPSWLYSAKNGEEEVFSVDVTWISELITDNIEI